MRATKFIKGAVAIATATLFLVGCGGGGGGGTPTVSILSGVAAGGTAVVGNVIVTDSKGATKSSVIGTIGQYTVDVSGMTGPFLIKASGKVGNTDVTYYSAATTADVGGTVNVTPFTNLIVSNIAAQLAVNYFSDPATVAQRIGATITTANLAAAETAMQAKLQPVLSAMNLGTNVDLLHTAFTADHTGLDAFLDLVKVTTDTSTNIATLTNAATTAVIGTSTPPATQGAALDNTPVIGTGVTVSSGTQAQFLEKLNAFAALFANGIPSSSTALADSGVFDTSSNFMMGGQTFAQFQTELLTNQKSIGLHFTNAVFTIDPSCGTSCTTGTLTATVLANDANFGDNISLKMVKDPTKGWLVEGDGLIANFSISAQAQFDQWSNLASATQQASQGSSMSNGIWLNIDPFAYNSNHLNAQAVSAVVTGPGLPTGGINMVQDTQNTWFDVAAYGNNNLIPECGTPINTQTGSVTATGQCVNVTQAVDNSIYTVVLKDGSGNSLNGAGYPLTLPKQPYSYSALTQALFPSFTATIGGQPITPSIILAGASVAISWTMPSGLVPRDLSAWANTSTNASYFNVQQSLLSTDTSTLFAIPSTSTGTVTNAGIWLEGVDVYGRRFATNKSVQN